MMPKPEAPETLGQFMARANTHYYATRDPLGKDGDFTTAPEISQIFGELLGVWCIDQWLQAGKPAPFTLLEMGPGRGTLMRDALRAAAQVAPDFTAAMRLHLLETSPALRAKQAAALASYNPVFLDVLALPPQPLFVIANEFFDALSIEQYRHMNGAWEMRGVDSGAWCALPARDVPGTLQSIRPDAWTEYSAASVNIMQQLATHIAQHGGAMVVADYGYEGPASGDTLQAMRQHQFTDPLKNVGESDLTAHVDFATLARAAAPLRTSLATQGDFLQMLGGSVRLEKLCAGKDAATQESLRRGYARLTAPDQMGTLFKVLSVFADAPHGA